MNFHQCKAKRNTHKKRKIKQKQGDQGKNNGIALLRVVFNLSYRCSICHETLYLVFDVSINRILFVLKCYPRLLRCIIGRTQSTVTVV